MVGVNRISTQHDCGVKEHRMNTNRTLRELTLVATCFVCACTAAVGAGDSVCGEAAEHLAACTGGPLEIVQSCEGESALLAAQLLTTSCDAIGGRIRSDAFSNGGSFALCLASGAFFSGARAKGAVCCYDHNCLTGLTCGQNGTCQSPAPAGWSCQRNAHCRTGLACVYGKCASPRTLGQSCGDKDDCAMGLTCGPKGTCAAMGALGGSCSKESHCLSGLRCIAGRCAPKSAAGGACDSGDDLDCTFGLVCVKNRCGQPPSIGGACNPGSLFQCEDDQTCWMGRCEPRRTAGQACRSLFDCALGLHCIDDRCGKL
jgi:hypothetical protein